MTKNCLSRILLLAGLLVGVTLSAQNQLQSTFIHIPLASQAASITQRIGLTDVTIVYHRPVAHGRKVFGGIVPYGDVWRAGANDNTTIDFSTDVKVEGQPLAKGVYGLHMIPGESEWTIIFSKNSTSWGSFTYDEKEDALRVKVKPGPVDTHDVLTYDFDELKPDSVAVVLRWERVAVPFHVSVDLVGTTLDSLHRQMRYLTQYSWEGLNDSATWCLENKTDYDEALKWVNQSIQSEERFENLDTKSQLLAAMNRSDEAKAAHARALEKANAQQLYSYARGLQREGKPAEAFEAFRTVVKKFSDSWISHLASARLLSNEGKFDEAAKEMRAAMAPNVDNKPQYQALEGLLKRLEAKQDINK